MLTQTMIDQARIQVRPFGESGHRYKIVNRALVSAEELLKMFRDEDGQMIDRDTLREAMQIQQALDQSALDARIEQIRVRTTTQDHNRYRVILDSFDSGYGGKPPEMLGTAGEVCAVLSHIIASEPPVEKTSNG